MVPSAIDSPICGITTSVAMLSLEMRFEDCGHLDGLGIAGEEGGPPPCVACAPSPIASAIVGVKMNRAEILSSTVGPATATVEELIRTIHAHPTMAEAIGEAAHATHGAAIHS